MGMLDRRAHSHLSKEGSQIQTQEGNATSCLWLVDGSALTGFWYIVLTSLLVHGERSMEAKRDQERLRHIEEDAERLRRVKRVAEGSRGRKRGRGSKSG